MMLFHPLLAASLLVALVALVGLVRAENDLVRACAMRVNL